MSVNRVHFRGAGLDGHAEGTNFYRGAVEKLYDVQIDVRACTVRLRGGVVLTVAAPCPRRAAPRTICSWPVTPLFAAESRTAGRWYGRADPKAVVP